MAEVNDGLAKLTGVNKKAAEQYTGFKVQREELVKRKRELDAGDLQIRQLIASLDMQVIAALQPPRRVACLHARPACELVPRRKMRRS